MIPLVTCRRCGEDYVDFSFPPKYLCQECRSLYEWAKGLESWDISRKKSKKKGKKKDND